MLPAGAGTHIPRHPAPLPLLFFGGGDEQLGDGSRYNPTVIQFLRDDWVHRQLQEREAEFTEYRPVRLFVGTWNVNGKFPKEDISAWLTEGADSDVYMPDVYVVGLQEMVDLTATNVVMNAQCGKRSKEWLGLLEGVLNRGGSGGGKEGDRFELLGTRYLVGVFLAVFAKRKYRPFVSGVQDATAAVGIFGVAGNKGAAALRLRLFDTTFCFVAAHLAAHQNAVAQRNADFHGINGKIEFRDGGAAAAAAAAAAGDGDAGEGGSGSGSGSGEGAAAPSAATAAAAAAASTFGVFDHDFLVWLGDFNYRISDSLPMERVFELVGQPMGGEPRAPTAAGLDILRRSDQLNVERAAGRAFAGFSEAPLTFRPTYKFQVGTSSYDARPEKKQRPPAWCDRILWRAAPTVASSVVQWRPLYYGSCESICASDHKPVHALFEVAVKSTMQDHRRRVLGDVVAALVSMENSSVPRLALRLAGEGEGEGGSGSGSGSGAPLPQRHASPSPPPTLAPGPALLFHAAEFHVPQTAVCILENTGDVAAPWRLLARAEDKVLCKTWLSVTPAYGVLPPRASVRLTVTVHIDVATARDLSLGRELAAQSLQFGGAGSGSGGGGSGATLPPPSSAAAALTATAASAAAARAAAVAAGLAAGVGVLEEVLIVRAERGKDIFCPVSVSVLPSAWGATLAQLARRPEPMRFAGAVAGVGARLSAGAGAGSGAPGAPAPDPTLGSRALEAALGGAGGEGEAAPLDGSTSTSSAASFNASRRGKTELSVPKEIWRLVDALYSRNLLGVRGLFCSAGEPSELRVIRACIDSGDALPVARLSPLSLGAALLELLSSLREPVIPAAMFPPASLGAGGGSRGGEGGASSASASANASSSSSSSSSDGAVSEEVEAWCSATLRALPPLHYNVLVYLVRFFQEVLKASVTAALTGGAAPPGATSASLAAVALEDLSAALSRSLLRRSAHDEAPLHAHHGGARTGEGPLLEAGSGGLARAPEEAGLLGDAGGGEELGGGGSGGFSDAGTRWEPSQEEAEAMRRVTSHLISGANLGLQ